MIASNPLNLTALGTPPLLLCGDYQPETAKETLIHSFSLVVCHAHYEWNQKMAAYPKNVEGLNQRPLNSYLSLNILSKSEKERFHHEMLSSKFFLDTP